MKILITLTFFFTYIQEHMDRYVEREKLNMQYKEEKISEGMIQNELTLVQKWKGLPTITVEQTVGQQMQC